MKSLRQKKSEQLAAFERKWRSAVVQLDDQLRALTLGDFLDKYKGERDEALRGVVANTIRRVPMGEEELNRRCVPLRPLSLCLSLFRDPFARVRAACVRRVVWVVG